MIFFCRLVRQESDRDPQVCLSVGQTDLFFPVGWSDRDLFLSGGQTDLFSLSDGQTDLFLSVGQTGVRQGSFSVGCSDRDLKFVCRLVTQTDKDGQSTGECGGHATRHTGTVKARGPSNSL